MNDTGAGGSPPRLPRIAYLVPEFPGQTHTWIWRELVWMRRWGAEVRLISTRPPLDRDRARHAFAAEAAAETLYLLPRGCSATIRLLADAACSPWGPCGLVGTRLRPVRRV